MALPEPINIAGFRLAFREVVVDGRLYYAPRGVARNNRNKSWQVKLDRSEKRLLAGNFGDQTFNGPEGSLKEALRFLVAFLKKQEASGNVLSISSHDDSRSVTIAPDVRLTWVAIHGVEHLALMLYLPQLSKTRTVYAGSVLRLDTAGVLTALNKALSLKQAIDAKTLEQPRALTLPHEDIPQVIDRELLAEILGRNEVKRLLARTERYRSQAQAMKEQKKRERLEIKRAREAARLREL